MSTNFSPINFFRAIAAKLGIRMQEREQPSKVTDPMDLTAVISNSIANLAMIDSTITISGDNERAEFIRKFVEKYTAERMLDAADMCLYCGDVLLKPWTDGKRIGLDIVKAEDFSICESIGDFVKSVIIRAETLKEDGGRIWQRFEGQRLEEDEAGSRLHIEQFFYMNSQEVVDDYKLPEAWREIPKDVTVPNCGKLLLGRYRCPKINRKDINASKGVSITEGLGNTLMEASDAYKRFNREQRKKETRIFADSTLFRTDENGNRVMPDAKDSPYVLLRGSAKTADSMIQEYSPDMRTSQLKEGLEVNLGMIEMLAGFSKGVLTSPQTKFATATEIRSSLQKTYAFVTSFRTMLAAGTEDLMNAVDVICNLNGITPTGPWTAVFDWSSAYVESLEEQFERLTMAESIGAAEKAEVRAYVFDEDLETARNRVKEITAEREESMVD